MAAGALSQGVKETAKRIGPSTVGAGSVEYHEGGTATIDVVIGGGMILHLVSCSGVYGPYTGTAQYTGGGVSGSSPASLSIDPQTNTGPLVFSIAFTGACIGNYDVNATGTLGGTPTSPTVTFAGGVSGFIACPGGGGPLSDTFNDTFPVQLGPSPECP